MKTKSSMPNRILFLIIILTLVSLIGCSKDSSTNSYGNGGGSGSPGTNEVWLQSFAFNPVTKNITAGTKITWTNKENTTHTVTSGTPGNPDGIFNSGDFNNGGTFSYTFNSAGTFRYYCAHHSSMTGTIIVQ